LLDLRCPHVRDDARSVAGVVTVVVAGVVGRARGVPLMVVFVMTDVDVVMDELEAVLVVPMEVIESGLGDVAEHDQSNGDEHRRTRHLEESPASHTRPNHCR